MTCKLARPHIVYSRLIDALARLRVDQCGTVAVLMGILLPILVGGMGLGFEISNWYLRGRAMQNAADAAATAAASNNGSNYDVEAKAVAAKYGYIDGSNNVTVTASNTATCPTGGSTTCYSVTISSVVPLYLSQVIGFKGDITVNGSPEKFISSTAIAENPTIKEPICILGLDPPPGDDIHTNGAPNSDLTGCTIMSNSDNNCNGSDLLATWGLAAGTNQDCGLNQRSNVPPVPDPYAYMATNIPADPCSNTYPQVPGKNKALSTTLPASNILSGSLSLTDLQTRAKSVSSGNIFTFCGDVGLSADTTIDTSGDQVGATIVIYNGGLDVRGHTLLTGANSGVTIVFAGDDAHCNSLNCAHYPMDNSTGQPGTLNVSSPKGGSGVAPFPGIALYQDPNLTTGVDFIYKGNNPVWAISGGVYLPNANITASGAVSQATNGEDCFVLVTGTLLINGTMNLYQQTPTGSGCNLQGLDQPHATIYGRAQLVF
jgi:Putative Flp pilus-assembly TadE/G-like